MDYSSDYIGRGAARSGCVFNCCDYASKQKERGLSGAIAGGTDTYLGRSGGAAQKGKLLSKLTTIVAIVVCCHCGRIVPFS